MNTNFKDFCKYYKEKLENDKDIKERYVDYHTDYRDRINFSIVSSSTAPGYTRNYSGITLFTLDKEDLKYLYDKYSPKVKEELEQNLKKIQKEYGLL